MREQHAFSADLSALLAHIHTLGFNVSLGEAARTAFQQAQYRATGASKVRVSQHQLRLAIDLYIWRELTRIPIEDLRPIGLWWESRSPANRWGGSWRGQLRTGPGAFIDNDHFERALK